MARPPSTHPTDGELELLNILWQNGPSGLGQICAALRRQRPIATTTVATILKVMLEKELVQRRRSAHGYVWSAVATRKKAANGMVRKLVDSVFDGSAGRLVAHLIESDQLNEQEREELRRLIDSEHKSEP